MNFTPDHIKNICNKYGLRLKRGVTLDKNRNCCPLGALLVEKFDSVEVATDRVVKNDDDLDNYLPEDLSISREVMWGVVDGFDGNDDTHDRAAYEFGRDCAKLVAES